MQEVQAWFKNPDYRRGVALYEKYGQNTFLKKIFAAGSTDYTTKKLREELEVLCPTGSDNSESSGLSEANSSNSDTSFGKSETNSSNSEKSDTKPSSKLHEYYLGLCKQRDLVNKQLERNMSLLDISKSKNVRFDTATHILSLHHRKNRIWAEIDYYNEHGKFPDPVSIQPVKTDEMQRLYVQISKAEKRLQSDKVKNPEKTQKLLDQKRLQLEALKRERGMI